MMGEGTVNDEELVEVIARAMASHPSLRELYSDEVDHYVNGGHLYGDPNLPHHEGEAPHVLAALRSAGFQVFRPEDCEAIDVVDDAGPGEASRWGPSAAAMDALEHSPPGTFFLVPADSGGRDER